MPAQKPRPGLDCKIFNRAPRGIRSRTHTVYHADADQQNEMSVARDPAGSPGPAGEFAVSPVELCTVAGFAGLRFALGLVPVFVMPFAD